MKTDENPLLLKINMGAGHGGSSGRYDRLHETAFEYAWLMSQVGIAMHTEDPWRKLRSLKGGGEVRVFKRGSPQPVVGQFGDATDENLTVVLKNEEIAIAKEQIERIDYRPPQSGVHGHSESRTTMNDGGAAPVDSPFSSTGATSSTSTSYSFGSKGDFQTVYRRIP
jgi:hypothetical protein